MNDAFHFIWSARVTTITTLLLAIFVFAKNRHRRVNLVFSLYCIFISIWSFCVPFHVTASSAEWSLRWVRILHIGAFLIPSGFVHFVYTFISADKSQKKRLILFYLASVFFGISGFTPWMVKDAVPKFGLPYLAVPGPLYLLAVVFFITLVIHGIYVLGLVYRKSGGSKRNQMRYLLWGTVLGYGGGIDNFLILYGLALFPFYPFGSYAITFYVLTTAYAIVRHHLMDIEVIIRKTLVFTGLSSFALAIFSFVTFLTQEALSSYFGGKRFVPLMISVFLIVLGYEPLRNLLVHLTDRYLFQKKEGFKVILNRLSKSIITILDLEQVGERILSSLRESLRLESGAIIIKDENDQGFQILNSYNIRRKEPRYPKENHLIQYLRDRDDIIRLEDEETKILLPTEVTTELQELNSVLCIPLFLHKDLIGILTLGKKKSDEEFTQDELDYVPAVAGQVAIALSNARLVDILKKSQLDFAQQAKMAAIGTLSAGIGHEIKNPLQIIKGMAEMLKINRKQGFYDSMTKEEYVSLVEEMVQKVLVAVDRAVGIIDRLSSFAKKPKEFKIEPMSVKEALEEALSLVKTDFENYSVNIERKYAPNLPDIQADMHAVGQAFFNILVNARHAVKEKGTVTVSTALRNHEVEISIQDTGPGIAPENLHKVFDPFFTTKDTSRNTDPSVIKGTGLGLFIVRETIKKFGGRITVESELGKGTTFHIFFPALQD